MINRQFQTVKVISYATGTDQYGQPRQSGSSSRTIQMVINTYTQSNTDDVRYADVTNVGLTADRGITDKDQIKIGDDLFQILYVIPSKRLHQILMKKV